MMTDDPQRHQKKGKAKGTLERCVPGEKLWIVFRRAYHSLFDFLETGISAKGVAVTEFIVLEALLHTEALTAAEIARKTRLSAASIETTIERLIAQDLVGQGPLQRGERRPQEKHALTLTEQGRGCISWIYEEHKKDIAQAFNTLTRQQQVDLYQSLRHVGHSLAGLRALPKANKPGGLTPWQLRRVAEYIRQHAAAPVTIKEIAATIGLSDSHFQRVFKVATGVSPHQWLLSVRIGEAQKLLKEGAVPLSEIALKTGFSDQSHFSRTFQRIVGVSPRAWQRDHDLH